MDPNLYSDSLERVIPSQSIVAASLRLAISKAITLDLSAYLKDRVTLEELYLQQLVKANQRLSRSTLTPNLAQLPLSPSQLHTQLGSLSPVLAQTGAELPDRIQTLQRYLSTVQEIEQSLRTSLSSKQWSNYQQEDQRLAQLVRELEQGQDKLAKLNSKSATKTSKSNNSKVLTAQSALTFVSNNLATSAPPFLVQAQALELTQAILVKEALTRYGTLLSDDGRAEMERGERSLGSVLAIEPEVEMQAWVLREANALGTTGATTQSLSEFGTAPVARSNSTLTPNTNGNTVRQTFGRGNSFNGRQSANLMDDSEITGGGINMDSHNELETIAPALIPAPLAIAIPNSDSSLHPPPSPALPTASSSQSRTPAQVLRQQQMFEQREAKSLPPPVEPILLPTMSPARTVPQRQQSDSASVTKPGFKLSNLLGSSNNRDRSLSSSVGSSVPAGYGNLDAAESRMPTTTSRDDQSFDSRQSIERDIVPSLTPAKSAKSKKRDSIMPFGASNLFRRQSKMIIPSSTPTASSVEPLPSRESDGSLRGSRGVPSRKSSAVVGEVDEEGYSVKPTGYDRAIEGGLMGDSDDDDDQPSRSATSPTASGSRFNVVSMSSPVIPTAETIAERQAALERVKNTLLSGPASTPSIGLGGLARKTTLSSTGRGRRDANRLTMIPTIPDDVPLGQILEQQRQERQRSELNDTVAITPSTSLGPISPSFSSPSGATFATPVRANSMLSNHSGTSSALGPRHDPFDNLVEASAGLRMSVNETYNVLIKDGTINRLVISGEISLNLTSSTPHFNDKEPLKIRFTNFKDFIKSAPNASILTPTAIPGEYLVAPILSSTTVVLRYQLSPPTTNDYLPLILLHQWKLEPKDSRASIIIHYSPNPNFARSLTTTPTENNSPFDEVDETKLDSFAISIQLGLAIQNFQSKPTGQFNKSLNALTFNSEVLKYGTEEKILARFSVEGLDLDEGKFNSLPIAVEWKILGKSLARVEVEVLEKEDVKVVDVRRSVGTGKYLVV